MKHLNAVNVDRSKAASLRQKADELEAASYERLNEELQAVYALAEDFGLDPNLSPYHLRKALAGQAARLREFKELGFSIYF